MYPSLSDGVTHIQSEFSHISSLFLGPPLQAYLEVKFSSVLGGSQSNQVNTLTTNGHVTTSQSWYEEQVNSDQTFRQYLTQKYMDWCPLCALFTKDMTLI